MREERKSLYSKNGKEGRKKESFVLRLHFGVGHFFGSVNAFKVVVITYY